jgi:DNA-binding NarL/FixJ family response regulator
MSRSNSYIFFRSAIIAKGITNYIQAVSTSTQIEIFKTTADILTSKNLQSSIIFLDLEILTGEPARFLEKVKQIYPSCILVALSANHINERLLPYFDHVILIEDPEEKIIQILKLIYPPENYEESKYDNAQIISEREIEILKCVALGLTNKEISDKLNISVHTVITHRKNITFKLGIKTIAGLTVYAILKNIISAEEVKT